MSEQVRRFYIMPSSVPVLLSCDPAYTPMTNHLTDVHTVPLVLATDYDALHAEAEVLDTLCQSRFDEIAQLKSEAEALRVALLGIASVNPAERGIEWAKSYASDGLKGAGSELYARWLETFKEAEALRAENERLSRCLATANGQAERFEREWYLRGDELEAARGLLRESREAYTEAIHWEDQQPVMKKIDAFLTATTSPDVPDHFAEASKMV